MTDEPAPVAAMSPGEHADFLAQLHWAVLEESPLADVPGRVTDVLPGGDVVHGPWRPDDCARVLLSWFDAGLLVLHRCAPDGWPGPDLDPDEARALLLDPGRWTASDALLVVTERGEQQPVDEWVSRAAPR